MAAENLDSLNSQDGSLEFPNDLEGFDNEFIPPDHSHECPICMMCFREPYQTDCGHRFCKNCIKRWLRANGPGRKCPACNEILTKEQIYPDNFAKREVYSLQAKCTYSKQGCEEQDSLKVILKHQGNCKYSPKPCTECSQIVEYKDMEEHRNKLCPKLTTECKACHHQIQLSNLETHKRICATATNLCPDCGEPLDSTEGDTDEAHICNRGITRCRFHALGCQYQCPATNMRLHMDECQQEHLVCLAAAVEQLRNDASQHTSSVTMKAVQGQLQGLLLDQPTASDDKSTITMAAAGSIEDLKKPLHRTRSLVSPGEKAVAGVKAFHSGEYVTENQQEVVLELRNRVASQQQHILELRSKVSYLENSLQDTRLELRDIKMDFKSRSCQGNFIWRLKNYQKLRAEAKRGAPNCILHSPGFYTSFNGYQFCIRLNLNGVENVQGTHLSLFIHLMQSENDDILPWPFTGKVTLSVCDQHQVASKRNPITETLVAKPGLAAFQRPTTFRNHKGFGYMEFAPISYLESEERCFIKDDTLLIKAEVRPNI